MLVRSINWPATNILLARRLYSTANYVDKDINDVPPPSGPLVGVKVSRSAWQLSCFGHHTCSLGCFMIYYGLKFAIGRIERAVTRIFGRGCHYSDGRVRAVPAPTLPPHDSPPPPGARPGPGRRGQLCRHGPRVFRRRRRQGGAAQRRRIALVAHARRGRRVVVVALPRAFFLSLFSWLEGRRAVQVVRVRSPLCASTVCPRPHILNRSNRTHRAATSAA